MPTTITSSEINIFEGGQTITFAEINSTFDVHRGTRIPIQIRNSAADSTGSFDLGSSEYSFGNIFADKPIAVTFSGAGDYTATATDRLIRTAALSTTTAFNIILPDPTGNKGKVYTIRKSDNDFNARAISVATGGSVDGTTTSSVNSLGEVLEVISDGVNYVRVFRDIQYIETTTLTSYGNASGALRVTAARVGARLNIWGGDSFISNEFTSTGAPFFDILNVMPGSTPLSITIQNFTFTSVDPTLDRSSHIYNCGYSDFDGFLYKHGSLFLTGTTFHFMADNGRVSDTNPFTWGSADSLSFFLSVRINEWKE